MIQDIKEYISQKKSTIFLVFGEEPLLLEEQIRRAKEVLNPDFAALNITIMDEKNLDTNRLMEVLESVPFMDSFRLVILKSSEIFKTGDKGMKKNEEEVLLRYFENPSESTLLFFTPQEVDKRSSLYKKLKKSFPVIELKRLDMKGLKEWCRFYADELGLKMKEALLELFISRSGYLNKDSQRDLGFIHQELTKLAALNLQKKTLQEEDIRQLFQEEMDSDIFKFTDSILQGKHKNALLMYNDMLEKGESPLMFLSMMGRQFSLIGRSQLLLKKGYSSSAIAQKLDIHPYAAKKAVDHCKLISREDSLEMLRACLDTEFRIKTGRLGERIGVELMITRVWQRIQR